jgi:hypothetical protein
MTTLVNGNNTRDVLVCGGKSDDTNMLSTCLLYNVTANAWTTFPSMPAVIDSFPMITLQGRPFVFGGQSQNETLEPVTFYIKLNTVYIFDTAKGVWSSRADMPVALQQHNAVATNNTTGLVCGGIQRFSAIQSACYAYSSNEDVWSSAAPMNTARRMHGMAVYKGVCILYKHGT